MRIPRPGKTVWYWHQALVSRWIPSHTETKQTPRIKQMHVILYIRRQLDLSSWIICLATEAVIGWWLSCWNTKRLVADSMPKFSVFSHVITHPYRNINSGLVKITTEVRAWMSNYIPQFYMGVINYSCPYLTACFANLCYVKKSCKSHSNHNLMWDVCISVPISLCCIHLLIQALTLMAV